MEIALESQVKLSKHCLPTPCLIWSMVSLIVHSSFNRVVKHLCWPKSYVVIAIKTLPLFQKAGCTCLKSWNQVEQATVKRSIMAQSPWALPHDANLAEWMNQVHDWRTKTRFNRKWDHKHLHCFQANICEQLERRNFILVTFLSLPFLIVIVYNVSLSLAWGMGFMMENDCGDTNII